MKTIIQTSKKSPIQKNVNMLMKSFDGWEYKHFNDKECIEYIRNNKTSEFSNSEKVFLSFKTGQHKADFFRYFYLYTSGGLFIDSDLMIYKNIDSYILETNKDFASCVSLVIKETIFQGFLFAKKENEIIYETLKKMYFTSTEQLEEMNSGTRKGYYLPTRDLFKMLELKNDKDYQIFTESHLFNYTSPMDNKKYRGVKIGTGVKWFGIHFFDEKVCHSLSDINFSLESK
jgi:hypothetical protein